MPEVKTEVQIAASPAKVWSVLTDFGQWKDWNPTVSQAAGVATIGSKLDFTMQCEGPRNGSKYQPTVTHSDSPRLLKWHVKMLADAIFANDKVFELKEVNGGTVVTHKEIFSGLLPSLLWRKMSPQIPSMLELMNKALKKKVEGA